MLFTFTFKQMYVNWIIFLYAEISTDLKLQRLHSEIKISLKIDKAVRSSDPEYLTVFLVKVVCFDVAAYILILFIFLNIFVFRESLWMIYWAKIHARRASLMDSWTLSSLGCEEVPGCLRWDRYPAGHHSAPAETQRSHRHTEKGEQRASPA